MKLFQNTIQILKQDKKNNFIIFLLQIIFLTLLNLHFFSYSFILGFVKKKGANSRQKFYFVTFN